MKICSSIHRKGKRTICSASGIHLCALCCLLLMGLVTRSISGGQPEFRVERGQVGQAKFAIAIPKNWSGHLLLLAHGFRPENAPLTADFRTDSPTYQHLLAEGWMIASTSYRRNGAIVVSAAEDINRLRRHIVETYGEAKRVLVQGSSMGGAIVALIAETRSEDYDGALALGAALGVLEKGQPHEWSYKPRIPLLFVSNQSEVEGPRDYVQKAVDAPIMPVLWYVARDGHVNLRGVEQETALRALNHYVETGEIERNKDATIFPDPVSSAQFKDGGAYTRVANITSDYGNIDTEFIEADLQRLGITAEAHFQIKYGEGKFKIFLGTSYGDVPRGEWVAFLTAEGQLRIARNFENAAQTLGCGEGNKIFIAAATISKE